MVVTMFHCPMVSHIALLMLCKVTVVVLVCSLKGKQLVDLCGGVSLFSTSLGSADVVKVHFNRV